MILGTGLDCKGFLFLCLPVRTTVTPSCCREGHDNYKKGGPRKMKRKSRILPVISVNLIFWSFYLLSGTEHDQRTRWSEKRDPRKMKKENKAIPFMNFQGAYFVVFFAMWVGLFHLSRSDTIAVRLLLNFNYF